MKLLKTLNAKKKVGGGAAARGFTLIEILVVVGIAMLVLAAVPIFDIRMVSQSSVDDEARLFVHLSRRAQSKAMSSVCCVGGDRGDDRSGSDFGLHITDEDYIIFQGDRYEPEDLFQEKFKRNEQIEIMGAENDIIFEKLSGDISGGGSLGHEIEFKNGSHSRTVLINHEGGIDW